MSEFLSRIKARLETGQHPNAAISEETGWVRAAVVGLDKEPGETQERINHVANLPEPRNGRKLDPVEITKVVVLGQDGLPLNLAKSGSGSDSDDMSSQIASQKLWDTGGLESRIPNGFYSVVPSKSLKARFKVIPSFDELKCLGGESDVLVVDATEDKILVKLTELVLNSVKSVGDNMPALIKKIAEMVSDFYGGPLFEAGGFKHPVDEPHTDGCPQLLGRIKVGLCRPRALMFKYLGDCIGLHSRLLMGLQLDDVASSSLICANPNKHLSNIVQLNGVELLVDIMRHPGHLRPFNRKALIMYHISGAGDSDSADYDSCDSPLEPNSPLFGHPDRLDSERSRLPKPVSSPDHELLDSPSRLFQRRQSSPITAGPVQSVILRLPVNAEGKLSPSRSEPDLANPYRRRNRRKSVTDERVATFSPERPLGFQLPLRRADSEGVCSFPLSSPEHPTFRVRAPSMLGGGRRPGGEEADYIGISSPEQSPQHFAIAGKHSPIYRRRSVAATFHNPGEKGRRERSLSIDVQGEGFNADFFKPGSEFEYPRVSSPDIRRHRKKSAAPEIGDDVVRIVRAMNEAIKLERSKSKVSSDQLPAASSDQLSNSSLDLQSSDVTEQSLAAEQLNDSGQNVPSPGESVTHLVDSNVQNPIEGNLDGTENLSSQDGTVPDPSSRAVVLKPPAWLKSPLMAFSEWNIDFKELRIGVRVGIGSFGEVFRGVWRGTEVAIKVMLEQDMTEENTADFCTEIALLSRLRHPNVILFMGACTTPPHLSMVTEYMHMGSLYSLLHTTGQGKNLSWRRKLKMLRDICRGLMSVQRMNIVHCDLKSANCLVDKHWSVKICDFGLSRLSAGAPVADSTAAGTPEWMAPELLRNDPVTDKCDIFSLGVIMWELLTLKRPWEGVQPVQVVMAVAHQNARLEIPEGLLGKLIADCWSEDPAARPTYDEILTRLLECEFLQS